MTIRQGDVYWLQIHHSTGLETPIAHPHIVIQEDDRNQDSAILTVTLCALTTNPRKINIPGNVLLSVGEANLPRPSIVEVSKVVTVEKTQLGEYIGTLSHHRVEQILAGMRFVQKAFFDHHPD